MAGTTSILGLRYPQDTDDPGSLAVETAIQHLAEDLDQYFGAWTAWTPQIDQGGTTNIAKTVNVARYRLIGKWCEFEMKLTLTAGGTASNKVTITLPQTSKFSGYYPVAWGGIEDTSAASNYERVMMVDQSSTTKAVFLAAGGPLGSSIFTAALASGDIIYANGFMEVA